MTGPEHYREAERLNATEPFCMCDRTDCVHGQVLVARAQVHATLADAAAAVDGAVSVMKPSDRHEWLKAMDPEYAAEQAAEVTR